MPHDDAYDGGGLVDRDAHDELDAAVRTFAEQLFECGFAPERALDMAWGLALLPEFMKDEDDW